MGVLLSFFFIIIHYTTVMTNALDQLIQIIPDHPALRLMHFVDATTPLMDKLATLAISRDYEYQLLCLDETLAASLSQQYTTAHEIKVRPITLDRSRYHLQGKLYDFVFVEASVESKEHFVTTVYSAMKNAANIFILLPAKADKEEIESWRRILEENFFVAFSAFGLGDTLQVVSAKKMHGWGG